MLQTTDQPLGLNLRAALQALRRERELLRPADIDLIDVMLRDLEASGVLLPPSPSRELSNQEPAPDSGDAGCL